MSPMMSYSLAEQETLFQELWCRPIESFFLGSDISKSLENFNSTLHKFTHERAESTGHVSKGFCCFLVEFIDLLLVSNMNLFNLLFELLAKKARFILGSK